MLKPNVEYSLPRYDKYSFKFLTLGFDVAFHLGEHKCQIGRYVVSVISVCDAHMPTLPRRSCKCNKLISCSSNSFAVEEVLHKICRVVDPIVI